MSTALVTPNKNFLSPVSYKMVFDGARLSNVEYFATTWSHPAISAPAVSAHFRSHQNFEPSDRLDYGTLDFQFAVDENMLNYIEMYEWIKTNRDSARAFKLDAIVNIMTSHNNLVRQIRYVDAFPVSLGVLQFDATAPDVEYIKCDASFQYSYFEFIV